MKKSLFGYNKQEVNDIISKKDEKIASYEIEIEKLKEQIIKLQGQNVALEHRLESANNARQDIARIALKEASELIERAKYNSEMIIKQSIDYVNTMVDEYDGFKADAIKFRENVKEMSEKLLDNIDQSELFLLIRENEKNSQ